jgi:hypothetical protein
MIEIERVLQNSRQNVFSKMLQILAVSAESLAASFAAGVTIPCGAKAVARQVPP